MLVLHNIDLEWTGIGDILSYENIATPDSDVDVEIDLTHTIVSNRAKQAGIRAASGLFQRLYQADRLPLQCVHPSVAAQSSEVPARCFAANPQRIALHRTQTLECLGHSHEIVPEPAPCPFIQLTDPVEFSDIAIELGDKGIHTFACSHAVFLHV